jgi:VCBS repeat-containing protein
MKKYLVLALFMVLGSALGTPSLSVSYDVTPVSINPGGNAQIIVTVSNAGLTDAEEVEISLVKNPFQAGADNIQILSGGTDLETISASSSSSGAFAIRASDNARPGTYILEAKGEYEYGAADTKGEFGISIPITVSYRSGLEIITSDTQITPGASENVTIMLNNKGKGELRDLILTLSPSNTYVYPVGNVRTSIEEIPKGESSEAVFQIRASDAAIVGIQPVTVSVTYTDSGGSTQTDTQSIGIVVVDSGTEVVIDSIESDLEPGKSGSLKVGVRNVGAVDLESLYFSISTGASLSIRGSNEMLLNSLVIGETKYVDFEFDVDQDAEAVPVESTLDITYQHTDGKKQFTDSKPLGIVVEGSVDLRVIDKDVDREDREVEIDVANYGNKDADAVKIEVLSDGEAFGTGYTDKIKPNKHKVFRFDIPSNQEVLVRMSYKDYEAEGGEVIVEESVTFEKAEIAEKGGFPVGTVIIVVLIVVVVLVWWLKRRSKNNVRIDVSKYKKG